MALMASKGQNSPVGFGWKAASFRLKGTDGALHGPEDARGPKGLVVIFMCNHCPYVKSSLDQIVTDMRDLKALGIGSIAVMPNDADAYPDDGLGNMQKLAKAKNFPFPYVIDETQDVARAYDAVCTPEFYGFDAGLALVYHGRLNGAGLHPLQQGGKRDLFEAMQAVAETRKISADQQPSMGCSIKWK